jgi:hypothetical protein
MNFSGREAICSSMSTQLKNQDDTVLNRQVLHLACALLDNAFSQTVLSHMPPYQFQPVKSSRNLHTFGLHTADAKINMNQQIVQNRMTKQTMHNLAVLLGNYWSSGIVTNINSHKSNSFI